MQMEVMQKAGWKKEDGEWTYCSLGVLLAIFWNRPSKEYLEPSLWGYGIGCSPQK